MSWAACGSVLVSKEVCWRVLESVAVKYNDLKSHVNSYCSTVFYCNSQTLEFLSGFVCVNCVIL